MSASSIDKKLTYISRFSDHEIMQAIAKRISADGLESLIGSDGIDCLTSDLVAKEKSRVKRNVQNRKIAGV